jgi:transposase
MSRRPIDISLSKDERSTLTTWAQANSTDQRLARRARIVMAAADGHSSAWISQELQVRRSTVSKWRNRFAARRIAALKDERRSGMPRIYDVAVEKRILKQLNEAPPRGYAVWNGRLVASVLGDVSADAVWRVLRRHRIDLRTLKVPGRRFSTGPRNLPPHSEACEKTPFKSLKIFLRRTTLSE